MATYQTIQAGSQEQGRVSEGFTAYTCSRCGGLFIRESLFDLLDDSGQMRCWALRCVQCGDVVDSLILKHRTSPELPNPKTLKRRRWSGMQAITKLVKE